MTGLEVLVHYYRRDSPHEYAIHGGASEPYTPAFKFGLACLYLSPTVNG
jgi:hypothetical protein